MATDPIAPSLRIALARRPHRAPVGAILTACALASLAGCSHDRTTGVGPLAFAAPLAITGATVSANPFNALSTVVTFTTTGADSARVISISSTEPDDRGVTPFTRIQGGTGRIVTLGLLPRSTYTQTLQVWGGRHVITQALSAQTGDLSPYLKKISLHVTGTFGPGYTVVSPAAYLPGDSVVVVAFDAIGRVRWYRCFPPVGGAESKQQPNGHFTVALGPSLGFGPVGDQYVEFLPSGEQVATYGTTGSVLTDPHDVLLTGDSLHPTAHFLTYTSRPFDFSPLGGPANGIGIGHQVVRQGPAGTQVFWDAWDHYGIADWIEPTGVASPGDFDHPNSLAFDLAGNYIVSFRNLGAVIALDAQTSATLWQLGGRANQFTIVGDPLGEFSGQHGVNMLPNGHLLLYDNGLRHSPPHSRVVEYALDLSRHVATMVWEYEPSPRIFTTILGSAQRLPSGNTLVGFGYVGQIHEVTPGRQVVGRATFSLDGSPIFYRAHRIQSLYQYLGP